jgi:hypothetical protein
MPDCAPKRVLMTGDTVGGVWTFTTELAEAMASRGVEVVLAAMGGEPTESQCLEAAAISNLQLLARPYKLEWMDVPWGMWRRVVIGCSIWKGSSRPMWFT